MKRGQSIVEVVIAAALISIAVVAALSLMNYSQKQTTYARSLDQATTYNSQVSDWLRKEKDLLGYAVFANKAVSDTISGTATYCLNSIPDTDFTTLTPGNCGTDVIPNTPFKRYITVDTTNSASGILLITCTITWQDNTTHTTNLEMELTEW